MKRVIGGKLFDTATATRICRIPCFTQDEGNFRWHHTQLYKSPNDTFFVSGEGGPQSMWAEQIDTRSWRSGSGLRLVTEDEARAYAEDAGVPHDAYEEAFGPVAIG